MAKSVVSVSLNSNLINFLDKYSKELNVSKSWIINQALQSYLDRIDESLSDMRIATLSEAKSHDEVLKEYGL